MTSHSTSPLVGWSEVKASTAHSAAIIPLFIALWVPFTLGTFIKPGAHPIRAAPGTASFGTD